MDVKKFLFLYLFKSLWSNFKGNLNWKVDYYIVLPMGQIYRKCFLYYFRFLEIVYNFQEHKKIYKKKEKAI